MFYNIDFHIHTNFSDGEGSIEEVLSRAAGLGLKAIAITDHFEFADFGQLEPKMAALKKHLRTIRRQAVKYRLQVFTGIETGYDFPVGTELREMVDIIIRSIHSWPQGIDFKKVQLMDPVIWEIYKDQVLKLLQMNNTDIAGHMMGYFPFPPEQITGLSFADKRLVEREIRNKFFDQRWQSEVIKLAARNNIAIEIHNPTLAPGPEFVRAAASQGVRFSLGSDAHRLSWVGKVDYGCQIFSRLKLTEKNLFWPGGGS